MIPSSKTLKGMGQPRVADSYKRGFSDRDIEQAVIAMKKGTRLLKYGRLGRPRACYFRLSADESELVYLSGDREKSLPLSAVSTIAWGQKTAIFHRHLRPDKENQSFSIIFCNGERTIDVICKDTDEAEMWFVGLGALVEKQRRTQSERLGRQAVVVAERGTQDWSPNSSPFFSVDRKPQAGGSATASPPDRLSPDVAPMPASKSAQDISTYPAADDRSSDGDDASDTASLSGFSVLSVNHASAANAQSILGVNSNGGGGAGGVGSGGGGGGGASGSVTIAGAAGPGTSSVPSTTSSSSSSWWDKSSASSRTESGAVAQGKPPSGMWADAAAVTSHPSTTSSAGEDAGGEALGDLFMWGEGLGEGALGGGGMRKKGGQRMVMGAEYDSVAPKALESGVVLDICRVACAEEHAALVTRQGEVLCWGEESGGRLGQGVEKDVEHPQLVEALGGLRVDQVACGTHFTCALTRGGDVYIWGDGRRCQGLLGSGGYGDMPQWVPRRLGGPLDGVHVVQVACGPWHVAVVAGGGEVFTFGDGTFGALGHGDCEVVPVPRQVQALQGYRTLRVACGVWHTAAVVDTCPSGDGSGGGNSSSSGMGGCGQVFTWGDGDGYKLGHGDKQQQLLPTLVNALRQESCSQVACGESVTVAVTAEGQVYTWGSAEYGQLGNPQADGKLPARVAGPLLQKQVEQVACGAHHVAALTTTAHLFTWGRGANGRLGHGDVKDRDVPTAVTALKDRRVLLVSCGAASTAVVCQHKPFSGADNYQCNQCRQPFTFARPRHSCYNCGQPVCHACSSRKLLGAAMAPSSSRPYRVCDSCHAKMVKAAAAAAAGAAVGGAVGAAAAAGSGLVHGSVGGVGGMGGGGAGAVAAGAGAGAGGGVAGAGQTGGVGGMSAGGGLPGGAGMGTGAGAGSIAPVSLAMSWRSRSKSMWQKSRTSNDVDKLLDPSLADVAVALSSGAAPSSISSTLTSTSSAAAAGGVSGGLASHAPSVSASTDALPNFRRTRAEALPALWSSIAVPTSFASYLSQQPRPQGLSQGTQGPSHAPHSRALPPPNSSVSASLPALPAATHAHSASPPLRTSASPPAKPDDSHLRTSRSLRTSVQAPGKRSTSPMLRRSMGTSPLRRASSPTAAQIASAAAAAMAAAMAGRMPGPTPASIAAAAAAAGQVGPGGIGGVGGMGAVGGLGGVVALPGGGGTRGGSSVGRVGGVEVAGAGGGGVEGGEGGGWSAMTKALEETSEAERDTAMAGMRHAKQNAEREAYRLQDEVEVLRQHCQLLEQERRATLELAQRQVEAAVTAASEAGARAAGARDIIQVLCAQMQELLQQAPSIPVKQASLAIRAVDDSVLYTGPLLLSSSVLPPSLVELPPLPVSGSGGAALAAAPALATAAPGASVGSVEGCRVRGGGTAAGAAAASGVGAAEASAASQAAGPASLTGNSRPTRGFLVSSSLGSYNRGEASGKGFPELVLAVPSHQQQHPWQGNAGGSEVREGCGVEAQHEGGVPWTPTGASSDKISPRSKWIGGGRATEGATAARAVGGREAGSFSGVAGAGVARGGSSVDVSARESVGVGGSVRGSSPFEAPARWTEASAERGSSGAQLDGLSLRNSQGGYLGSRGGGATGERQERRTLPVFEAPRGVSSEQQQQESKSRMVPSLVRLHESRTHLRQRETTPERVPVGVSVGTLPPSAAVPPHVPGPSSRRSLPAVPGLSSRSSVGGMRESLGGGRESLVQERNGRPSENLIGRLGGMAGERDVGGEGKAALGEGDESVDGGGGSGVREAGSTDETRQELNLGSQGWENENVEPSFRYAALQENMGQGEQGIDEEEEGGRYGSQADGLLSANPHTEQELHGRLLINGLDKTGMAGAGGASSSADAATGACTSEEHPGVLTEETVRMHGLDGIAECEEEGRGADSGGGDDRDGSQSEAGSTSSSRRGEGKGGSRKSTRKLHENEWVEQPEQGVYITLSKLPGGGTELRRVRFSRKRFIERQAETWWAQNKTRVMEMYTIKSTHKRSAGEVSSVVDI